MCKIVLKYSQFFIQDIIKYKHKLFQLIRQNKCIAVVHIEYSIQTFIKYNGKKYVEKNEKPYMLITFIFLNEMTLEALELL